jgi:hypothetical protein
MKLTLFFLFQCEKTWKHGSPCFSRKLWNSKSFLKPTKAHPRIIRREYAGIRHGTPGLNNYQFYCGGRLIGPRIVLKAAHCLFGPDENPITLEQLVQT